MAQKKYKLSYLPIFYDDLLAAVNHITLKLKNKKAAEELIYLTETAIKESSTRAVLQFLGSYHRCSHKNLRKQENKK